MPVTHAPNLNYNPVDFVKSNRGLIIPDNSTIRDITFSGFVRKAFHSYKRPKGVLTIHYDDENGSCQKQLFVKQHARARQVYNHVSGVYNHLNSLESHPHLPKPILCDEIHEVNYMEYIDGTPLPYILLKEFFFGNIRDLKKVFYNIGKWLSDYHQSTKLEHTSLLDDVLNKVRIELDKTSLFNIHEKKKINSHLNNLYFEDDFLLLVKTHNDFALRNIIFTKEKDFYVIDWDAMYNEKFELESPVWIDISSFLISFNSLQRFSPIITARRQRILNKSFLKGYFKNSNVKILKKAIKSYLYLFSLCFYLGVIGEMPLPSIYKEKLGYRYMYKLRKNLSMGKVL